MFVLEIRYFANGYIIGIFQFKSYTNYPNLFQKLRFFWNILSMNKKQILGNLFQAHMIGHYRNHRVM